MTDTKRRSPAARHLAAALALGALATMSAGNARASTEIIPSFGVTKSIDTNARDAKAFGGLAIRAAVFPFLKLEGGIAYRQDSYSGGDVKVRQWPVTASAWVAPLPMVYAGGGVGWYRTTFDFPDPIKDPTTQKMGVHLGGGVELPVAANLGLDLNGRYIFMQKDKNNVQLPTTFNPDYWNLALGLAIKF